MKKELKGYERYKMQWMIDHGYSLKDLMNKIAVIINEELCVGGNAHELIDEAFDMLENETGFVGSEIWACEDEWEDNENDSEDYDIPWDLLDLFNERERALEMMEQKTHGSFGIIVFREDFDEITPEMEDFFDGEDEFEIYLKW